MRVFDCRCTWRFIIGDKQVYGPIYLHNLPGHFTGDPGGCYTRGRLMTTEEFADQYGDCAYNAAMINPANVAEHVHPFTD